MHVHIDYHRKVVRILSAVILAILALLAMAVWQVGIFDSKGPSYLKEEEVVVLESADKTGTTVLPVKRVLFEYIQVIDSCRYDFEGACLNARSGPGEEYPKIARLRNGMVLKVEGKVERDGRAWYKIVFDEWLRYPKRLQTDWYVNADYVNVLLDEGNRNWTGRTSGAGKKKIVVDRSEQTLYAYDGDELFMKELISTGIELTPTPKGIFTIFKKTPSRYMQGPIPNLTAKEYDLPGVPWNLYFSPQGDVIHGTYWHENFGRPSSNGCINLPPLKARQLYNWAEVGTRVTVQD